MSLDRRVGFMQDRVAYMAGFGIPATLITSFGPPLVNMAIFALLYPIVSPSHLLIPSETPDNQFVIQAIQSRPPTPRNSLLPSTPSPSASLPPSPTMESFNDPFFNSSTPSKDYSRSKWDLNSLEFKLPIFFFARYALQGLSWLEAAVLRDRGSGGDVRRWQERAGKRLG
jgi:etoposide-induced 2.4 mRNA